MWAVVKVYSTLVEFVLHIWHWLNANTGAFTLAVTLVTSVVLAVRYLSQQRILIKDRHFRAYHALIRDLVVPQPPMSPQLPQQPVQQQGQTWLDRQIAIVYESRNFPEYYGVTLRILRGLRAQWFQPPPAGGNRLLSEMDLTLAFVERRRLPFIKRLFRRKPNG